MQWIGGGYYEAIGEPADLSAEPDVIKLLHIFLNDDGDQDRIPESQNTRLDAIANGGWHPHQREFTASQTQSSEVHGGSFNGRGEQQALGRTAVGHALVTDESMDFSAIDDDDDEEAVEEDAEKEDAEKEDAGESAREMPQTQAQTQTHTLQSLESNDSIDTRERADADRLQRAVGTGWDASECMLRINDARCAEDDDHSSDEEENGDARSGNWRVERDSFTSSPSLGQARAGGFPKAKVVTSGPATSKSHSPTYMGGIRTLLAGGTAESDTGVSAGGRFGNGKEMAGEGSSGAPTAATGASRVKLAANFSHVVSGHRLAAELLY